MEESVARGEEKGVEEGREGKRREQRERGIYVRKSQERSGRERGTSRYTVCLHLYESILSYPILFHPKLLNAIPIGTSTTQLLP